MRNSISIDLEDWYQGLTSTSRHIDQWPKYEDRILESSERILDILARANVKATFFVLGYVADTFPKLVQKVAEAGHEIALHGYHHRSVKDLTPDQFRLEIKRGRNIVEEISGKQVIGFRAPMFSINGSSLWALECLNDMGFRYDSSVYPTQNMLYGYPEAPRSPYNPINDSSFVEFPLATVRYLGFNWPIAGGFYLRFWPYSIINWGVNRINREGKPAVIYVHPWDLDPEQPRPNPTLRERFTHYYNLHTTEAKLTALLSDFEFGPICDLLNDPYFVRRSELAYGSS